MRLTLSNQKQTSQTTRVIKLTNHLPISLGEHMEAQVTPPKTDPIPPATLAPGEKGAEKPEKAEKELPPGTLEDFAKVDIRVGKLVEVWKVNQNRIHRNSVTYS
jgi:hypothetical protein